jgi:hypothetical protein
MKYTFEYRRSTGGSIILTQACGSLQEAKDLAIRRATLTFYHVCTACRVMDENGKVAFDWVKSDDA